MSLKEDLEKQVEGARERIPPETFSVMTADTERLRQSGIVDNSLKAGDKMPPFTLPNAKGEQISSDNLLARGPLVLSFYRGGW
jgi:hypothetical protein